MAKAFLFENTTYDKQLKIFVPEFLNPTFENASTHYVNYRNFIDLYDPHGDLITLFVGSDTDKTFLISQNFPSNLIYSLDEIVDGHYNEDIEFTSVDGLMTISFKHNTTSNVYEYGWFRPDLGISVGSRWAVSWSTIFSLPSYYETDQKYYLVSMGGGPSLPSNLYWYVSQFNHNAYIYMEPNTTDPYDEAGTSDTGGGTGDLDGTSDSIDIPSLPTLTAVDSGFVSLFNPTLSQLKSLSSYMWGSLFDLDNFKKLFNDPMDCILGLSIVPVNVPSGGAETITVGNLITAVTMNKATTQYVAVDCGTLNVNEYWGAYLDYAPHTKAQIYLPYCGTHDIDVDDIMNNTVHVVYHIDILTGGCVAYIKCGSSVMYEFPGNCATQIPITNNDFSNMIKSIIDVGVAVGGALATGGMSAPLTMASAVGSGAESLAGSSINGGMKPNVSKSGAMGSSIGLMGVQTPYIILTRPRQCVPSHQNEYTGYPSYITETLGSLSGYTELHSIHLDGIPATDEELNEIESLLYKGVIL